MKTKTLSRSELSFRIVLELVDHRDDQATEVGIEDVLQVILAVGTPNRDVVGLHLAEQASTHSLSWPSSSVRSTTRMTVAFLKRSFWLEDQLRSR